MYENVTFVSAGKFVSREPWIHKSRTIDTHEIIFALEGQIPIAVGDENYLLFPGDVLHLPPNLPHRGTAVSPHRVSFYWVHFTAESVPFEGVIKQTEPSRTEILCKQLLHCISADGYPAECADSFVRILLMELAVQKREAVHARSVLCTTIEEWIRGNADRPVKVSDLAVQLGFNADYLNRVFRRYHPEGLKAYIDLVRCQNIRRDLCSTDLSLQEISQKFGFQSYKYFLKYFRLHEGITPTEFRNAYYMAHVNRK